MIATARLLTPLAVIFSFAACSHTAPVTPAHADYPALPSAALQPSPHKLVGRVLAVDATRGFAFVDLTTAPPAIALADGAELIVRTDDLRETARLRTSRYVRGRTLGTTITSGQPVPGNEVVILAP